MNKLPKIKFHITPFDYKGLVCFKVYHFKNFIIFNKRSDFNPFPKISFQRIINSFKQLSPSEPQHSRIICDLLNPNNHLINYGSKFLELFFKYVLNDNQFEYGENDIWEVTAEQEKYDIRIRNKDNNKIIIIENKSNWANDQPNQLFRYWYHGIYLLQKNADKKYAKIIYLTPSEFKKYNKQSITRPKYIQELEKDNPNSKVNNQLDETIIKTVFFNKEILVWLDECMKIVCKKDNLYYYLLQYKDFWGTL